MVVAQNLAREHPVSIYYNPEIFIPIAEKQNKRSENGLTGKKCKGTLSEELVIQESFVNERHHLH